MPATPPGSIRWLTIAAPDGGSGGLAARADDLRFGLLLLGALGLLQIHDRTMGFISDLLQQQ